MPWKFNPFSVTLDQTGSGGGGGAQYLDGEVATYNDLPLDGTAAADSAWLVRSASGSWLIGRKPAGIYIRTATAGVSRDADYTYAGIFPDVFSDANFTLYDDGDATRTAQFQLSGITTGTNRVVSLPDKNITLDDSGDSRTPTSHASSHAAAGSDPVFDQDLDTTDSPTFTGLTVDNSATGPATINFSAIDGAQGELTVYDDGGDTALDFVVGGDAVFTASTAGVLFSGPFNFSGVDPAADRATSRTNLGLGDSATADIGTGSGDVAAGDHTHGNLTNDGKIGSTAGLPLKTGTAGVVEAGAFGTSAGEFAEGNHTHTQLHDKSHTMTDATSHTAGNHKVFYSDGNGNVQELALGNSGEVLTSNGATSAPSFAAASGGGVTGAASSASDVLGVSGSDITGVDAGSDKIVFWDDSASELTYLATVGPTFDGTNLRWPVELIIACSDESTDLTTGTAKVTFRAPYAFLLTGVRASVNTAPTGSTLIVDINNGANSALSTKLSIDASEKTSTTAASAAVIDTTYDDFSDDAEITIDIDQIGSTIAGKGLKVTLIGTRA